MSIHKFNQLVRQAINKSYPVLILLAQNVFVFKGHYFENVGFPWDFPMAYYAIVAFWTSAVSRGIYPQWLPFQQMGYPFALQLQSGINYFPLWIFPILHIPYTLNAAVAFQCLHVLFGGLGMFILLSRVLKSIKLALAGAVIFQFFGGFYSNAEHPDIIRAFALTPWLLYVFHLRLEHNQKLPRQVLLIPFALYLLATGAYPGNIFSTTFILSIYVLCQLTDGYFKGYSLRSLALIATIVLILTILGFAMSLIQLGPAWVYREQFVRSTQLQFLPRISLWVEHLPGLFLSNRNLPGEISMTSTYTTLPALIFLSFIPISKIGQYWNWLLLGVIGVLMTAGTQSTFWTIMTNLIPILGFSRFPSSDYRVFVAIPIIIFSSLGLHAILNKQVGTREIIVRTIFIAVWFFAGLYTVYQMPSGQILGAILVAGATLLVVLGFLMRQSRISGIALAAVLALISFDAYRVLPDIPTWQEPKINTYYSQRRWPYEQDGQLVVSKIFDHLPTQRPNRENPRDELTWAGYIDGRYMMEDLPSSLLLTNNIIISNKTYQTYMQMEWSPLLLNPVLIRETNNHYLISEDELTKHLAETELDTSASVEQIYYGINQIIYKVSLDESRLIVENEVYFPGWRSHLLFPNREQQIMSLSINNALRAWLLPAGQYQMIAEFQLPEIEVFRTISFLAFVLWLFPLVFLNRLLKISAGGLHEA